MFEIFKRALSFNGDLNWDTSNVQTMGGMFQMASKFNSDSIAAFDTSNCLDMANVFAYASAFNVDVSSWNTERVTTMNSAFRSALSFNHDLLWNTAQVRDFSHMFQSATSFNGYLSFQTSRATDTSSMFHTAASFTGKGLSSFDTSSVQTMESMFFGAVSWEGSGIAAWSLSSCKDMNAMFAGASNFAQDLCRWKRQLSESVSTNNIFAGTSCPRRDDPDPDELSRSPFCFACDGSRPFNPPLSPFDIADGSTGQPFTTKEELHDAVDVYIDDESSAFLAAEYGYPIGRWDVSLIEDFSEVFSANRNPRMFHFSADLGGWNLSSARTTESMFEGCVSFTDETNGLSSWDVSSVTNMHQMFDSSAFAGDISRWNVQRCEDFGHMFHLASHFNADLQQWRPRSAKDMSWMFRGAKRFSSDLSKWRLSNEIETINKMVRVR